jgi:hypothetical protein
VIVAAASAIALPVERLVDRCDRPQLTVCPIETPETVDHPEREVGSPRADTRTAVEPAGGSDVTRQLGGQQMSLRLGGVPA